MNAIVEKIRAALKRRADRNGDGKLDQADIDAAVTALRADAAELVSKQGALAACAICFAVGVVVAAGVAMLFF